jgi:hypothetical protein
MPEIAMKKDTITNMRFLFWMVGIFVGVYLALYVSGARPQGGGGGRAALFRLLFSNWTTILGGICGAAAGEAVVQAIASHYSNGNKS